MNVVDIRGYDTEVIVGPQHGATRIFLWAVAERRGFTIGPHHHHGEELFRVLDGHLLFTVGETTREVGPGSVIVVPPGVTHGHTVLEAAEIEIYGQTGTGIFRMVEQADGSLVEEELFVDGVPWSRTPSPEQHYLTVQEQNRPYRTSPIEA